MSQEPALSKEEEEAEELEERLLEEGLENADPSEDVCLTKAMPVSRASEM